MCGSRHSRCFLSAGIRQLQLILLKVALLMGVEVHVGVEFKKVLEPPEDQRTHSKTTTSPPRWFLGAEPQNNKQICKYCQRHNY